MYEPEMMLTALLFAYATGMRSSRAIGVSGAGAWARIIGNDAGLVLIPTFEAADIASALHGGHHANRPRLDGPARQRPSVMVPPLDR
ncbi:MAG: hypothetical protein WAV54_10215 [Acidimicrobiales bacterium]|jgi:hypothetical protein